MDIRKIKKIFKKYLAFFLLWEKHTHSKIYRHWEVIILTFLIINFLQLGFSLYLFLKINEGRIFLVEQSQDTRVDTIDRTVLQELLSSFEVKEALFQERSINAPRLSDPS